MNETPTITIAIPARLDSKRLPRKPLREAGGKSLIRHTVDSVLRPFNHSVVVLTDSQDIADQVPDVPCFVSSFPYWCGTQRIAAAVKAGDVLIEEWYISWGDYIVLIQCDEPCIKPEHIRDLASALNCISRPSRMYDIATLVAPLSVDAMNDPNVAKAHIELAMDGISDEWRCRDFTRSMPPNKSVITYHHVGVYAFRKDMLIGLGDLKPSIRSQEESLEQLTWLDHGHEILAVKIDEIPLSINTEEDLAEWSGMLLHQET